MRHEVQHMVAQKETERRIHLDIMHILSHHIMLLLKKKVLSINFGLWKF